jgi:hypothetical protein
MKLTKILPMVALLVLACCAFSQEAPMKQKFANHAIHTKSNLLYSELTPKVVPIEDRKTFIQRKNIAKKIELRFRKRGINDERAIVGAWVNAWHESEFDPKCESGGCKGIFQLLINHEDSWLYNADRNINILLNESPYKERVDKWYIWVKKHPQASVQVVTVRFATEIERCAKRYRARRGVTAKHWWKVMHTS